MMLSKRDLARLSACHQDLQLVVLMAAKMTTIPFMILETSRTIEQQRRNVANGVSWTMKSRHLLSADGFCRAADLVPMVDGKPSWAWPLYRLFIPQVKEAAKRVGITIECGADWTKTPDGPHIQLPWDKYANVQPAGVRRRTLHRKKNHPRNRKPD